MKRITTLLLAAMFSMSCMAAAQAESSIDVKVKGQWDFSFGFVFNSGYNKNGHDNGAHRNDDNFNAMQRVRTQVNFIVSENLQAVLQFEIGDLDWGRGGASGRSSGAALGADGVNIETKHAYLDWMVPETNMHIRMGLQPLALPSTSLGSNVFDDDVAAVVASYAFDDTFAFTAFWARPYDAYRNDGTGNSRADEVDMFGLIAPITLDGATITPWFMYASVGAASGIYTGGEYDNINLNNDNTSSAPAWWLGLATEVTMFDPLTFGAEFVYGYLGRNTIYAEWDPAAAPATLDSMEISSRGWYIAANLDYALDWGTPGIFGWYASGDKAKDLRNHSRLGRLPTVAGGQAYSSFGSDGGVGISPDERLLSVSNTGTWGLGIQIADMSFIEDLSHTLRFIYYNGTNDRKIVRDAVNAGGFDRDAFNETMAGFGGSINYLTTKDHAYEVNFDHTYQIYENLAAVLELGYIKIDRSERVWGNDFQDSAAWKGVLSFQFTF